MVERVDELLEAFELVQSDIWTANAPAARSPSPFSPATEGGKFADEK
jgi:hypothetical protein